MRLCWFIPDDRGGGTASVALSCCRQAARHGHEVTLLMGLPPTGHHAEHVEQFEVDSLHAPTPYTDIPGRLVDWLKEHPQDVVFVNGCSEVEPALSHLPPSTYCVDVVHDTASQYWERTVSNEAVLDAIVAVSATVARQFQDRLVDPSRLSVCHNGTVFPPMPSSDEGGRRSGDILFVGGGKPIKGCGDVIDLWPVLVDRGFQGQLHWFGGLTDTLRESIASLPEHDRIVDHGRVPRSEIFARASRSKVLLMLSRVEPFGMVTIEAMGMGALPVAWDIPTGTKEIVTHGETGFFASLGDLDALASRVVDALRHHEQMRDETVRVARERFSEEAMWERYAERIDALTRRPPVDRPDAGTPPPEYDPPRRYFQMVPEPIRAKIRSVVEKSPKLGYWLRDWRGF